MHENIQYTIYNSRFLVTIQPAADDNFSNPNKPFVLSSAAYRRLASLRYAPFDTLCYSGRTGLLRANGLLCTNHSSRHSGLNNYDLCRNIGRVVTAASTQSGFLRIAFPFQLHDITLHHG